MKIFTKPVIVLLLALAGFFSTSGQSIMQPTDTVYTYNSAAVKGSPTNPNQPATANTIGKWIRTVRMSWNTSNWKCYIYNGVQFRLRFNHLQSNGRRREEISHAGLFSWIGRGRSPDGQ